MTTIETHDHRQPGPASEGKAAAGSSPGAPKGSPAVKGRKKVGKKSAIAIAGVAAVALFGGYQLLLGKSHVKPTKALPGPVVSLPQTTINLADGHLLQVSVAVLLQQGILGKSDSTLPPRDLAPMENDEITVFSQFSEAMLLSAAGKAQAKVQLLADFRSVVGPGPVGPGVMAVYFTEFVMQ